MTDLSGQILGKYTLIRPVGQGGMATVYLARHESDDRPAAAKVLHRELAGDPDFAARFRREARIIAGLQHPNILQMFDFGEQGEYVYFVMQYISGGSLADELDKGPLPLNHTNQLIQQIGSALAYAHQQGVIHRDLKPENILLDEVGNSYLTDFGIAKIMAGTTHLTKSGLLMGTPNYMAPEQWLSQPIDGRTDVYAMGMIIYEMLVGLSAFDSDTAYGIMYDHFDKMPASPVRYHPGLPSAVEAVIFKAIAKLPGDRYASTADLAEDFDRVVQRAPHPEYRPERPAKRFDSVASAMVEDFGQSTYELPRVIPEELPDWVKKLEGVPGSKKPFRMTPTENEAPPSAPTAPTPAAPAVNLSLARPEPPIRPAPSAAEPSSNETILPHMLPPANVTA
ncbi:MAG: serine/threonine protein kinase, partial [Chloroflexi bacterium]|nr:serine/threonine protein kinase [Chloroflexota bacterium]